MMPWPGHFNLHNNFVICGQKHKVRVLVFLEREEHFEIKIEQNRQNRTILSNSIYNVELSDAAK